MLSPEERAKQIIDALCVLSYGAQGFAHPDVWQEYIAEAIREAQGAVVVIAEQYIDESPRGALTSFREDVSPMFGKARNEKDNA